MTQLDLAIATFGAPTPWIRPSYLLVATGPWIFGKTVMLPAGVTERVDHENKTAYVSRTKDEIKNGPEHQDDGGDDTYRNQLGGCYACET
jgi:hypothetical protein